MGSPPVPGIVWVQVTEMDKAILIAQIVKVIVDVLPGLRHLVGVGKTQQIVRATSSINCLSSLLVTTRLVVVILQSP